MREVVDMAAEGRVKSHIGRTAALADISDVFDDLQAGRYVGRAVITDFGQ
jgi:D-arabinose 1-dehydrogenase-like Zn-dependent alcohol dehydrogenase